MSLKYNLKPELGFDDLVDLKLLLDEMYEEILVAPKEQEVLYGLRNSLGYWQDIMVNDLYHLVWVEENKDSKKIALSIARFPNKKNFYIDYVFVKPEYRNQGIAYKMMELQINLAKEKHSMGKEQLLLRSSKLAPIVKTI